MAPTAFPRDKRTDWASLLGSKDETKPRLGTAEEIKAKYRNPRDAASAALNARNKLVERQETLAKIDKDAEELEGRAEDFASMANQLAQKTENRKWWKI